MPHVSKAIRAAAVIVLAAAAALAVWWTRPPDPVDELRAHAPDFSHLLRSGAPDLGARFEHWTIVDVRGESTAALWRAAVPGSGGDRSWTVVLLGGLHTGVGAARLMPDDLEANVLALDWPWDGPDRMDGLEFVHRLPAIRRAVLRSAGTVALGVAAVAGVPGVDPNRIAVLGASLGVPPAIAALRLTSMPRACILLHGAADLRTVLKHNLKGHVPTAALRNGAAAFACRLIQPLEPTLHAHSLRGMQVLIVNAVDDARLPSEAVAALHAAFPWADIRWRAGGHMRPRRDEEMIALAVTSTGWLQSLQAGRGRAIDSDQRTDSPARP